MVFDALCLSLVLLVLGDLLTGSQLLRQSTMSYSVTEGARFYGIGNEYMGAVIGACCMLAWRARLRPGRYSAVIGLLAVLTLVMGAPWFGAKVGAVPSAGAALGMLWLTRPGAGRVRGRSILGWVAAGVAALALFAVADLRHAPDQQTHLARAFSGAGGDSLGGIILRKWMLEGSLLVRSAWSATLTGCVVSLGLLLRERNGSTRHAREAMPALAAGAIASLVCNDSGLTAAALIGIYACAGLLVRDAP